MARLDEIFDLQMGKTPSRNNADYWTDGQYNWVSIADLGTYSKYVEETKEKISALAVQESGIKSVPSNTVIMSFKLSLGKTAITQEPIYTNEAIMAFIPTGKYEVLPDYFYHLFSAKDWTKGTNRAVMGTTLNKATLGAVSIAVPPIDEQRKIVMILDKVSDLLAKHHQQLDKLDELVKSRFIEMFGDPVTNSKGLVTRKGSEFFTLTNGKFVPEEKRRDEGIPAYGGNGISWYTDEILVTHDTIVVGRVGFQSGNVHFVTGPLWVTDNAMYISDFNKDQYDLRFLCALMEHIDFTRFQDAGDLKKITQKPFMQMSFIAPLIQQQKSFITFVEQVDKSKLAIQKSLEKLEILKKALIQEYFG